MSIDVPYYPKLKSISTTVKSSYVNYIADYLKIAKSEQNVVIKKDLRQTYDKWFNDF
jgi:hypothetical protein